MTPPLSLIIEDDTDLAEIFRQALEAAGYATEVIYDGRAAETRLKEVSPAVIVLDIHLPHVSGESLLHQIRAEPNLSRALVVVTTADAIAADLFQAEADFTMVKPISFGQLRDLTRRLNPSAS